MVRLGVAAQTACVSLALMAIAPVVPDSAQAQAPSSSVVLDRIDVEASRGGVSRQSGAGQPGEGGQDESAYGPVQGYVATRSATGTKTDTPIQEIPQSITVVTAEAARDQGATSVQEALRYVPGVYADAFGPDTRGDYPKVRGSDPNIFLDGTQAVNAWRSNEWRPDPYTLSRIEVLRGPASILYGAMSTAGILNLVSKLPQAESHREIGMQYGSFNRKQLQADLTGKLTPDGEWLYRLIGVFRDSDYQTDYVKNDRILVQPAVTWQPTKTTSWTLMGFYQKDTSGSSTAFLPWSGTIYPNPNGQIPINRFTSEPGFDIYQNESASMSSIFEHSFSDSFKIRQSTRYLQTDGVYRSMYPNNYGAAVNAAFLYPVTDFPFVDPAQTSVLRYAYIQNAAKEAWTSDTNGELKFGTGPVSHKVLFGVDYRRVKDNTKGESLIDPTPFNLYAPVYAGVGPLVPSWSYTTDSTQTQTGLYIQDQMRFGPWIAVVGIRHDQLVNKAAGLVEETNHATTKRTGLMYELPGGLTPYITWGQSFDPIFGSGCVGGSLCKPKEGELKEVGFKYNPWKGFVVNAALYDITEKNRTASDPAGSGQSTQLGEVRVRGGEVEVLGSITRDLDIVGAYSYTHATVTGGDFVGSRVEAVPLHQASLWAKQKFSMFGIDGFSIGAGARYVGESSSTGQYWNTLAAIPSIVTIVTPGFMLYDTMFAYENDKWRFQVNATNLADKIYVSSCLARGDCFYGNRRTVLATLTYKF
jgi:iron complex outermembrane receptor protein